MGYKQKIKKFKKRELREKKRILQEWVLVDRDSIKPISCIKF